ncbi:(2Fe-2S)-binding protein [Nocardioides rubriscoriae]|uniref:(2Fe-2S)-binding protein n=1 Tax=Nocardioides rubriscoriae TaxID=642762 RepID=UPI0014792880|nr:(2Fe-2S)-binding protein [Nocardioides rubriscoriae]
MRPVPAAEVRRALGAVAAWAPDLDPDDRYVDLVDLVASGLPERVSRRLRGAPLRVGYSAVSMGVASRLWSLTVVPALRGGIVVDPAAVCARDDDGSVVLGVRPGEGLTDLTLDDLHDVVLAVLGPVVEALPLSAQLHWGNVAGSLAVVPRVHGLRGAEPAVADLLGRAPWVGLMDGARRRTCCLFYLAPGAGLCGDCALDRVPAV